MIALAALAFIGVTSSANAATAMLATDDFVGITFWLVSMGMLAGAVFFFLERNTVAASWRTSVTVAKLQLQMFSTMQQLYFSLKRKIQHLLTYP